MTQRVIQDFLSLPGIAGVAVMDGSSRPYFHGVDQSLNFQQREALAQGIQQVVKTIPPGFESFEFQFTDHQVHIYKIAGDSILMVLADEDLEAGAYQQRITSFKTLLQKDFATTLSSFRNLAAQPAECQAKLQQRPQNVIPLVPPGPAGDEPVRPAAGKLAGPQARSPVEHSESADSPPQIVLQSLSAPGSKVSPLASPSPAVAIATAQPSPPLPNSALYSDLGRSPNFISPSAPPSRPLSISQASFPSTPSPPANLPATGPSPHPTEFALGPDPRMTLRQALEAMAELSDFTAQYLGTAVIVNYWRSTKPNQPWLTPFQVERDARFRLEGMDLDALQLDLTQQQQQALQLWVQAFTQRSAKVMRDFELMLQRHPLSPNQRSLLGLSSQARS